MLFGNRASLLDDEPVSRCNAALLVRPHRASLFAVSFVRILLNIGSIKSNLRCTKTALIILTVGVFF